MHLMNLLRFGSCLTSARVGIVYTDFALIIQIRTITLLRVDLPTADSGRIRHRDPDSGRIRHRDPDSGRIRHRDPEGKDLHRGG